MGMTVADMKRHYDSKVRGKKLKAKDLKVLADQMQAAKKSGSKSASKTAAPKPRQTTKAEAAERFYSSSSQGSIQKNQDKAKSNFFRSSSGTRGQNLPSNPQLKSKPKRSDFPAGRGGQAKYAAALRTYNKKPATPRRAALTMEQRRRARRSSNRR